MQEAMTALFSFPFFASQRCSKVLKVLMKKVLSYLYWMLPQSEPMIHERELSLSKLKSVVCCFSISLSMNFFISAQLYLTKNWASSF